MPSIAQQDYIFIHILDGGELPDEIPQDIQNRLVQLAEDGRALDVVLCEEGNLSSYARPIFFQVYTERGDRKATYCFFSIVDQEVINLNCTYREITNEPDAQEEH